MTEARLTKMIKPWSEKIWFSPCYVIGKLREELAKGTKLENPKIKALKEAWIGAVVIETIARGEGTEWWLQIPAHDPPDVIGMKLVPRTDKGQDLYYTNIEIFVITEFNTKDIKSQIKAKIKDKDYSQTLIVGYVLKREPFIPTELHEAFKLLSPDVFGIYLLGHLDQGVASTVLLQVYPFLQSLRFDLTKYCSSSEQRDYVEMVKGLTIERIDNTTQDTLTLVPPKR